MRKRKRGKKYPATVATNIVMLNTAKKKKRKKNDKPASGEKKIKNTTK